MIFGCLPVWVSIIIYFLKSLSNLKKWIAEKWRLPSFSLISQFLSFCLISCFLNPSSLLFYGQTYTSRVFKYLHYTKVLLIYIVIHCSINVIRCIYKGFTMCHLLFHWLLSCNAICKSVPSIWVAAIAINWLSTQESRPGNTVI